MSTSHFVHEYYLIPASPWRSSGHFFIILSIYQPTAAAGLEPLILGWYGKCSTAVFSKSSVIKSWHNGSNWWSSLPNFFFIISHKKLECSLLINILYLGKYVLRGLECLSWSGFSWQDKTRAEFSTLKVAECIPCTYVALKQNCLT